MSNSQNSSLAFFGVNPGSYIQKENNQQQYSSGQIKEQISDSGLVKNHSFNPLTNLKAVNQEANDITNPKNNTENGRLSNDGMTNGNTVEQKNSWPTPTQTSDNLSNWESDRNIIYIQSSTLSERESTWARAAATMSNGLLKPTKNPPCGGLVHSTNLLTGWTDNLVLIVNPITLFINFENYEIK